MGVAKVIRSLLTIQLALRLFACKETSSLVGTSTSLYYRLGGLIFYLGQNKIYTQLCCQLPHNIGSILILIYWTIITTYTVGFKNMIVLHSVGWSAE